MSLYHVKHQRLERSSQTELMLPSFVCAIHCGFFQCSMCVNAQADVCIQYWCICTFIHISAPPFSIANHILQLLYL